LKRRTFLATSTSAVALAPAAAGATVAPRSTPQWTTTVPITGPAVPQLAVFDRVITGLMRTYAIPGGQCAVAKDGRLVYARGFGYVNVPAASPTPLVSPTALFRIASSTKPFTAVAILRLVEAGRVRLNERAFTILDDLTPPPGTKPDRRLRDITVYDLLQHTGGFQYPNAAGFDPQFDGLRLAADVFHHPYPATSVDLIRWAMGQPLAFTPGTVYNYSNLGYNILGRIIERRTGLSYGAALKALVLDPAGLHHFELMTRTSPQSRLAHEVYYFDTPDALQGYSIYDDDPLPEFYSYGGFDGRAIDAHGGGIANAPDLVRFLNAVNGSTQPQLLSAPTLQLMLARPAITPTGQYYGLGWDVNPANRVVQSHAGAITFGTLSAIFRLEGGVTFAILFNHLDPNVVAMGLDVEHQLITAGYSVVNWPSGNTYSALG
jgi:CubicO group peptidase (beta-lactamase class C family)